MLEEFDALSAKLAELAARMRALKEENKQLRAQSAAALADLAGMRERVTAATQRIDALLARLPREDEPETARTK